MSWLRVRILCFNSLQMHIFSSAKIKLNLHCSTWRRKSLSGRIDDELERGEDDLGRVEERLPATLWTTLHDGLTGFCSAPACCRPIFQEACLEIIPKVRWPRVHFF